VLKSKVVSLFRSDKRKPRKPLYMQYNVQRAVTQDSNNQVPGIAQKAARNRRRQSAANVRLGGPIPRKHSSDGATWHASGNQACYLFIDPRWMKGWVGLVGWPVADSLST